MPQNRKHRQLPLLRAAVGLLSRLALTVLVGLAGMSSPPRASASESSGVPSSAYVAPFGVLEAQAERGALVRSSLANAPAAAVISAAQSDHPETPIESEARETGKGSIEEGDDLSDVDDFAYQLRVVLDSTAHLNREVERRASLGGGAASRLEDNRSDKPPRG